MLVLVTRQKVVMGIYLMCRVGPSVTVVQIKIYVETNCSRTFGKINVVVEIVILLAVLRIYPEPLPDRIHSIILENPLERLCTSACGFVLSTSYFFHIQG